MIDSMGGREVGKLTIGIVLAIVLVAIVMAIREADAKHMEKSARVEAAKLAQPPKSDLAGQVNAFEVVVNGEVVKAQIIVMEDRSRGVACYVTHGFISGTTMSCVKVTP